MRLQKYPAYVEPNALWLPSIPKHWETASLGSIISRRKERNRPDLPLLSVLREKGVVPRSLLNADENHNYIPDDLSNYRVALAGDLVVNKMKAWQGSVGIAPIDGVVSPAYFVFSLKGITKGFAHRLLRSRLYADYFARASDGVRVGQWDLSIDQMKRIPVLLPPHPDQDQIVAYLRAQDAHIARFIKAKRDLIKLLTEQKLRIIDHAVTRGLDASVALKPSGIEWLGEVPEHWEISRLSACIKTIRAGVWGSDPSDKNLSDQLVCVRVADFDMEKLAVGTSKLTVRAVSQNERSGRLLCSGDILLEKSGGGEKTPVGRVVAFTLDKVSVCSNFLARLVPNTELVRSAFLLTVLNHLHARRIVIPYIKQTTGIQNLDSTAYFKLGIALPSLNEQDEILQVLARDCKPIEEAIQRANEEIKLIREYRDRLIADVVTGQVDVRGWQPGPEDVVDDAALGDDPEDVTEEEDGDGED